MRNELKGQTEPVSEIEDRLYPLEVKESELKRGELTEEEVAKKLNMPVDKVRKINKIRDCWSENDWIKWFENEVNKKTVHPESEILGRNTVLGLNSVIGPPPSRNRDLRPKKEDNSVKKKKVKNDVKSINEKHIGENASTLMRHESSVSTVVCNVCNGVTGEYHETSPRPVRDKGSRKGNPTLPEDSEQSDDFVSVRVWGMLDGVSLYMIVDTGAAHTLISRTLWEQLGRPAFTDTVDLQWTSASGHRLDALGKVELLLQVGHKEVEATFIVMKELCFDVLLGVDVIHHLRAVIDVSRRKLTFHHDPRVVPLEVRMKPTTATTSTVYLAERVVVRPGSSRLVAGQLGARLPEKTIVLIEKTGQCHKGEMVANMVASIQDSMVYVEILIPTLQSVEFHKGLEIAFATQIPERCFKNEVVRKENTKKEDPVVCMVQGEATTTLDISFEKSSLNEDQREELRKELYAFHDIFVTSSKAPGRTEFLKFSIDTGDAPPIKSRPYRVTQQESDVMEKEIDQYLKLGLIRESQSPWSISW